MIPNIAKRIKDKFGLKAEVTQASNVMFLKVEGLDNYSLARWIIEEFDNIKVSVKEREGYKILNSEWIKIEKNDNKELILTQ